MMRATIFVLAALSAPGAAAVTGSVVDAAGGAPLAGAIVTSGSDVTTTDAQGRYVLKGSGGTVAARAYGYGRAAATLGAGTVVAPPLRLAAVRPKALYLSFWGIGDRHIRQAALDLADHTEINALVVDIKSDSGWIPYPSKVALAEAVGARKHTTVRNMPGLVAELKQRGLYLIARIVVFKDDALAGAHPEWAVHTEGGACYRDREGLAWADPARPQVWAYNLDIAEEAAQMGFDEIQFDYVRFPDQTGLTFSVTNSEDQRVAAISGFLAAARQRLTPYNVFISADVFGYVFWNENDTFIGQKLGVLGHQVDYLAPMLYPSGFQFGIPGYTNPVAHPSEIVLKTLNHAGERSGLSPLRFRPWLQAFRDYAFDHRAFGGAEIRQQIDAADKFGSDGWMLWNPHNEYSRDGLGKR